MDLIETIVDGFLVFDKYSQTNRKTYYIIVSNKDNLFLGNILWERGWRRYTFQPKGDAIFDTGCLRTIADYIDKLMSER